MRYAHMLLFTMLALSVACSQESANAEAPKGEGAELPSLAGGKADEASFIDFRGALGVGDEGAVTGLFEGGSTTPYHAYEIDVAAGAEFTLEVSQRGSSRGLDTVLYLFGPRDEFGGYNKLVGYDDDEGWGRLSRLRDLSLEAGTYLAVVGTYSGRGEGDYRLFARCEDDACAAAPTDELLSACVFGEYYQDLFGGSGAITVTRRRRIEAGDSVTSLEEEQLIASVASTYDDVETLAEAFAAVDQGVVNQTHLWDGSTRRGFIAYEFGAGDNSYGMIVEHESAARAALITDGGLSECTATWGEERRACAMDADCASGLRCEGIYDNQGACLAENAPAPSGLGGACDATIDCGDAGLVCAGESLEFGGWCTEAWTRRAFSVEASVDIPDADPSGATVTLDTYGLATVHTDIWLDLWIWHEEPGELRVTLTNPLGTQVVLFDGESDANLYIQAQALSGFPGDEDANGTWTLHVVDSQGGTTGRIERFALDVGSRWD